ncbi:MAG TPA: PIN domain-containing protein [Solirubrobacteraceae bacterium]|nr:PIN domain-containing protein [Solirubrobacteraceae bacterium]
MIAPDSSVVIAALAPWHEVHHAARDALQAEKVGLPAHVALETTSALSRMPQGRRIAPGVVLEALERAFPDAWLTLTGGEQRQALRNAVDAGVRGGALYDALIAATAIQNDAQLLSADGRARATYDTMGVRTRYLDA